MLCVVVLAGCSEEEGGAEAESPFLGRAAEITDLHAAAKWAEIREDFDDNMRQKLTEQMLADAWRQLVTQLGPYQSRGEPRVAGVQGGVTAIDTPMFFEKGEMKSRVSFRRDGKIAGLFILNKHVA